MNLFLWLLALINKKASTNSPAFTGTPTAPTAASGTDTTQLATTAFVQDAIAGIPAAYPIGNTTGWNKQLRYSTGSPNWTLSAPTYGAGIGGYSEEFRAVFKADNTSRAVFNAPSGWKISDGDSTTAAGGTLTYTDLTPGNYYECSFVVLSDDCIGLVMKDWGSMS